MVITIEKLNGSYLNNGALLLKEILCPTKRDRNNRNQGISKNELKAQFNMLPPIKSGGGGGDGEGGNNINPLYNPELGGFRKDILGFGAGFLGSTILAIIASTTSILDRFGDLAKNSIKIFLTFLSLMLGTITTSEIISESDAGLNEIGSFKHL